MANYSTSSRGLSHPAGLSSSSSAYFPSPVRSFRTPVPTYVPPACLASSAVAVAAPPKTSETPLWHSVHQAGGPTVTAFDINSRGNRVYLKFEPHAPTFFPVKETRFYKPKLHKTDFLGTGKQRSL